MDDGFQLIGVFLLIAIILGLPVGLVVLIITYVSRTNSLTRQVDHLESELSGLKSQIVHLRRAVQQLSTDGVHGSTEQLPAPHSPLPESQPALSQPQPDLVTFSDPARPSPIMPERPGPGSVREATPTLPRESQRPIVSRPPRPFAPPISQPAAAPPSFPSQATRVPFGVGRPAPASSAGSTGFRPPSPPSRTRAEWEALIGGKLLNRIGALALVLGIIFFLRYAFDRDLIPEAGRVAIGAMAGLGLLGLGWRFNKRGLQVFAQGLVGAGIAILYASVYASFNFYHLVPQPVAFMLMSIVTAGTFLLAIASDSLAVAILGWFGGFLTPWLLSTGQANEIGLFTYLALLDIGLLAIIATKFSWFVLEPMTIGATCLWYVLWYSRFYEPGDLWITSLFLTIFWLLFYGLDIYRVIRPAPTFAEARQAVAIFNGVFYYCALFAIMNPLHHNLMGPITVVIGAIHFVTILAVSRGKPGTVRQGTLARFLLSSILLLALGTAIQFTGFDVVFYWSIEALVLVWCGLRWRQRHVWVSALVLFGLASVKLFFVAGVLVYEPIELFSLLTNKRAISMGALAISLALSAVVFRRQRERRDELISEALHYGWTVLAFVLLTVETRDHFRARLGVTEHLSWFGLGYTTGLTLAIVWMAFSLPLIWIGVSRTIRSLCHSGLAVLLIAAVTGALVGARYMPIESFVPIFNYRAAALLFLIGGLVVHSIRLRRRPESFLTGTDISRAVLYVLGAVLFVFVTTETNDYFQRQISLSGNSKVRLEFIRNMTFVFVWMSCSLGLIWIALKTRTQAVLHWGIIGAGAATLTALIKGWEYVPIGDYRLLINYRAAALVFVAAGVLLIRWLISNREASGLIRTVSSISLYFTAIVIFVLCTVEIKDQSGLMAETAFEFGNELLFRRNLVLVVTWAVYSVSLIRIGRRNLLEPLLHCGAAALLGALVLGGYWGVSYLPIQEFGLIFNVRAAALAFVLIAAAISIRWFSADTRKWAKFVASAWSYVWCALLFLLLTVEIKDHFDASVLSGANEPGLKFSRSMILASVWSLYSFGLIWYGLAKRRRPSINWGSGALILSILWVTISGFSFRPIEEFSLIVNLRAVAMTFVIVSAAMQCWLIGAMGNGLQVSERIVSVLRVVVALLVLDLITVEAKDNFDKAIALVWAGGVSGAAAVKAEINRLRNLQQMWLSVGWLMHSIVLMGFGIWQRIPSLRILSIVLFGICILKIFIYDLSFLDTFYRIFLFIGSGLILYAASYLYQKYKAVILETRAK